MEDPVKNLVNYPFDQYTRQALVFILSKGIREDSERLKIIDLGGHKGITKNFFAKDQVSILDVFDEKYPGYIKGDATNLIFEDNSFDLSVSFDTIEHIEPKFRDLFIKEALRVSKKGFFMAAPIDENGRVKEAENKANDLYKLLHGHSHKWLKEHIDLGIPDKNSIENVLKGKPYYFVSFRTNDLNLWFLFQSLIFLSELEQRAYKNLKKLQREFNEKFLEIDTEPEYAYRRIYFITENKTNIDKVVKTYKELQKRTNKTAKSLFETKLIEEVVVELAKTVNENNLKIKQANKTIININQQLNTLQESIYGYENSLSWRLTKGLRATKKKLLN